MKMNRFHISFEALERLVTRLNSLWGYSNHDKIHNRVDAVRFSVGFQMADLRPLV